MSFKSISATVDGSLQYAKSFLPSMPLSRATTGDRLVEEFQRQQEIEAKSIITDEDEAWLQQVAANVELPPRLPPRRSIIDDDGHELDETDDAPPPLDSADHTYEPPLPPDPRLLNPSEATANNSRPSSRDGRKRKYHYWQYIPAVYIGTKAYEQIPYIKEKWNSRKSSREHSKERKNAEDVADKLTLEEAEATGISTMPSEAEPDTQEAAKEKKDMNKILNGLHLSAMNDRVVGLSKESQKLLESFTQVLKDIVAGAPTAYDDLEKLLTDSGPQLQKMFDGLPPFLQTLVKSLPEKLLAMLGPEVAVYASASGKQGAASASSGTDKKKKTTFSKADYLPSLQKLVMERAAVATMLKSILNFLKLRFPAILAPNVLISLAVFLLLFVFWYCHKRGREERLQREGKANASSTETEAPAEEGRLHAHAYSSEHREKRTQGLSSERMPNRF